MTLRRAVGFVVAIVASLVETGSDALAQTFVQEQVITDPAGPSGPAGFGTAVAIDGLTAVVSNSNETGAAGVLTGAVYVYVRNSGSQSWVLQQRIEGPGVFASQRFGTTVALSGDTLAVGNAPDNINLSGRVDVYVRTGTTWTLQASPGGGFYPKVSLKGDTLVVGSLEANTNTAVGLTQVYERTGTTWSAGISLPSPGAVAGDFTGSSVGVSGETICVGASGSTTATTPGAVRVYVKSGSTWGLQQQLSAPSPAVRDRFGFSCVVDGDSLLVGPKLTGAQFTGGYVYVRSGATWALQQQIGPSNAAGLSIGGSVALRGDVAVMGGGNGVNVHRRAGTSWTETQTIAPPAGGRVSLDDTNLRLITAASRSAVIYTLSATPPPPTAPGAPTNVQAAVSGNTLNLTWSAPTSGGAPTSYTLLARTAAGAAPLATVPLGAVTSFAATAPNGTFLLSLTATNAVGTGPESAVATVTFGGAVAPPASPTGFGVSVTGSTATFTWTAPVSGGPPAGYVLQAGLSPGFTSAIASLPLPVSPTSFSIPGVPVGTFYVRLVAQNAGGTSGPSNEVTLTVAGASAPGAPTLSASASGRTVNVSWTPGSGGAPTGYTLSAAVTPGGAPVATVPLGGTSVSFANVPSGTYYLRLTASNGAGTSPASNEVAVTVP